MPESVSPTITAVKIKLICISIVTCFCLILFPQCDRFSRGNIQDCHIWPQKDTLRSVLECEINNIRKILPDDSIPDMAHFFRMIDSASSRLTCFSDSSGYNHRCVDTIIKIVYEEWKIGFQDSTDNIRALLPNTALIDKKGSCLGTSLIFLLIAEKANLPVFGVLLPGHFFVRYINDSVSRNIEPNRSGYYHPDSYYIEKYGVKNDSWYILANLSKMQTSGVFYFNLANIYRSRNNLKQAIRCYRKSTEYFPDYAEAWGNLAIAYDMAGYVDSAWSAFNTAEKIRPEMIGLKENIRVFKDKHEIK
jgi:tetratricopeptide (TPR) repeat protein